MNFIHVGQGGFRGNLAVIVKRLEGTVHRNGLFPAVGVILIANGVIDISIDGRNLVVPDFIADGLGHMHNLESGHPVFGKAGEELLRNDGPEHHTELDADLVLLSGGEGVHNPVDGAHGAVGMEGSDHQMPRSEERRVGKECRL